MLLASALAGLVAGTCIGGLIAANFAVLATEEKEKEENRRAQRKRRTRRGINRVIRDQPFDKDSFLCACRLPN